MLHKDLIERIRPASIADWKTFILQVDQEAYGWLEWQAYAFAGLVLVPEKFLKQDFSFELNAMQDKIAHAKRENIPTDSYEEYVIEAIAIKLIPKYEVSRDVLVKQMSKEIGRGGLKIP
ncbi:MAG: hypothetical protein HY730_00840 [Candidatus Tectomicrobia bacterium]|uniref:Uncharacterized protein n=1 Tax=Tectimicrobiota bacterium TaxID=2528274 RepID=A0A933GJB0_UNCTE|nr:hypothetical protein [Candidatus Tectomicrobia bacterium]